MKKEYIKPNIEVKGINVKDNITALNISKNPLDWINGSGNDSINWE